MLGELADHLPRLADELLSIRERLWDLYPVVKDHLYYPAFHGSFSLKAVLPVLVPGMDYSSLDVQEGGAAGIAYVEMIQPETKAIRKAELRRQLLKYCKQDTLAMVKLHEKCLKLGPR